MASAAAILDAYTATTTDLRDTIVNYVERTFAELGSWRDADIEEFVRRVTPMIAAGQRKIAAYTDAYLAQLATLATGDAIAPLGIPRETVVEGLRTFRPDAEHNPGRMNFFSMPGDFSVVMDLAHNEAGLEALLEIMAGVRRPGSRLLLGLGAVGDRQDDLIEKLGEIGARDSDVVAIGHKQHYLRGREQADLDALLRAGAERVGVTDLTSYDTELESLQALCAQAEPGDVVGLMCHAERQACYDWIASQGGTPDSPETLADKVRAARASG